MSEQDKAKKKQKINNNLKEIFYYFSDIKEYYENNCQNDDYIRMTIQLLRQAIKLRSKKAQKHYNVAYIKHHRFLSPQQKSNVTPKVTQIIPNVSGKVKIFQKPKMRQNNNIVQQDSKYLSPKQIKAKQLFNQNQKVNDRHLQKKKKQHVQMKGLKIQKPYSSTHIPSKLYIQSNYQTMKQQFLPSRQVKSPKYDQVQSKIKDLVDRDRRNKKLQDIIEQQNKQIQMIESRQQILLSKQLIQERRSSLIRQNIKTLLQEAQSSYESSLQQVILTNKILKKSSQQKIQDYKNKLKQKLKSITNMPSQHILNYTISSSSNSSDIQN